MKNIEFYRKKRLTIAEIGDIILKLSDEESIWKNEFKKV